MKAGFRSTTGYSGFVDAVMSVFIASAAAARIPPVRAAAAAANFLSELDLASAGGGGGIEWFLLAGTEEGGFVSDAAHVAGHARGGRDPR